VPVDSLSLRATPVFLTANPSIRTFAEAGTLVFLSEQEEEREDSISTRFMVGDLSAYCKGQYATRSKNTTRSPSPVPTPESKSGIAVEAFL
jgi:hypothetical protein